MGSAMHNENNGAAIHGEAAGYCGVGIDTDSDSDADPELDNGAAGRPNEPLEPSR